MTAGIYSITSPSGKQYIGSAVNISSRWSQHRHHMRRGTHCNAKLQAAANKYGVEALVFAVVVRLEDITTLIQFEQAAFAAYQPEYNILPVAGNTLGYKHTQETKARFHLRAKTPDTPEKRAKQSLTMTGRKLTEAHRANIAASRVGKKHSEATLAAMSAAQTGARHSPETVAKRAAALTEAWARRRAANGGVNPSSSAASVPWTPERRAKHAATIAARHAAKAAEE